MARKYHTGSYLVSVMIASKCMTHGMLRLMYYFIVIMPYYIDYMIKALMNLNQLLMHVYFIFLFDIFLYKTLNTNQSWQGDKLISPFLSLFAKVACKYTTSCLQIYKCNTTWKINFVCYVRSNGCYICLSPFVFFVYNFTTKLPSKGICREVIGIASLTLCWNTVSESSTVTPEMVRLHYFCSFRCFLFIIQRMLWKQHYWSVQWLSDG